MKRTADSPKASATAQYLSFIVAGEEFAIPILRVVEIVRYEEPSRVPSAPPFLRGVVGVRGQVVPIVDLAVVCGFKETAVTRLTCIVLVEIAAASAGDSTTVGILVEAMREVSEVAKEDMTLSPSFGTPIRPAYIAGLYRARGNGSMVFVLEIDRILSDAQIVVLERVAGGRIEAAPEGEVRA